MKTITLDPKIYPIEAILNCCYSFIDRAYIYLDKNKKKDHIDIFLKGKEKLSNKQWDALKGAFLNELLYSTVRYQISKNNKNIREYIIGRALYNTSFSAQLDQPKQKELDYLEDPLGIAIPWEKKYGKKKKIGLKFNSSIYPSVAIRKAILAYSDSADFKVKNINDYTLVEATNISNDCKNSLVDEFKNYCLGIIQ